MIELRMRYCIHCERCWLMDEEPLYCPFCGKREPFRQPRVLLTFIEASMPQVENELEK